MASRKKDKRSARTERIIREALLDEMRDRPFLELSVTSVCKRAQITRPTFYLHYRNLSDVLDDLAAQAAKEIGDAPLEMCAGCASASHQALAPDGEVPFCELATGHGHFAPLFADCVTGERIVERIVEADVRRAREHGASEEELLQIRAINLVRMNGCMAAARSFARAGEDWKGARDAVDHFVAAGLSDVLG